MPYPAAAVANEFLRIAQGEGYQLSPMKLQKLVYFAHGWYLALTGAPLINEPIQAWKFGPVIPSLYQRLKHYGNKYVTEPVRHDPWSEARGAEYAIEGPNEQENAYAKQLIAKVWEVYKNFSAIQLSNMTHEKGSPWDRTDKSYLYSEIDPGLIRSYFQEKANAA